jgi:hypothetical protein
LLYGAPAVDAMCSKFARLAAPGHFNHRWCGERLGAERPALAAVVRRDSVRPGRSSGLLDHMAVALEARQHPGRACPNAGIASLRTTR